MKHYRCMMLAVLMVMTSARGFSQQTSLVIDNQTPGWLSSKIDYADQLSVENLKVTGYINTDDICFLEQLSKKRSLQVLDLEDVHMAPGGTSLVAEIREGIYDDDMIDGYVYTGLELRKLITSKHVTHYNKLGFKNSNSVPSHKIDTLIIKEVCTEFNSDTSPARMLVVFPEGVELLQFIYGSIGCSFHIPSTLQKLIGYSIDSSKYKVNITSFHEDPSNIVIESYNSQISNVLKGDTLWIPAGTREKYLNTNFKNMRVIIEMTPPNAIEIREGDERCQRKVVYTDDTFILNAGLIPQDAYYKGVIWKTSNPSIAEVDQSGKVTAVGYGNAQVIVCSDKDESIADTCDIVVYDHTTGISISKTSKDLNIGESFCLTANTLPTGTSDNQFTWSSSNEEVAIVDTDGKVTGLKLGSCIITATAEDGGSKAECVITVVQPAKELSLSKHIATIKVGEKEELRATISPESTTDKSITWVSRDNAVAEVSSVGIVSGKKAGKVFIVAQAVSNTEAKDSCEITVLQPATGIELDKTSLTFNAPGERAQLTATVLPADASDKGVRWYSSNPAVCTVSESGVVVATGSGSAIVTATSIDGGFVATCAVTVAQPVSSISLNKHTTSIRVGSYEELQVTISPDNASDKSVTWSSSNNDIVSVSESGVVTARKAGRAFIVVRSKSNTNAKDSCEVTVLQPVTGVIISESTISLSEIGSTKQLTATVLPEDASDKTVRWDSSNTSVCTVSGSGVVVAVGTGTSVISVTTTDGGYVAVCVATVSDSSGIMTLEIDSLTGNEEIYNVQGKRMNALQRGLNIIRMSDGTTKKVIIK